MTKWNIIPISSWPWSNRARLSRLWLQRAFICAFPALPVLSAAPGGVEPAKFVEAVRLAVIRQQGQNHMKQDEIPALLNDDLPQQAIVSAMRKYSK